MLKPLPCGKGQLMHHEIWTHKPFRIWEVSTVNLEEAQMEIARLLDDMFKEDDYNFETMVFRLDKKGNRINDKGEIGSRDYYLKRYKTEKEATDGHAKLVAKIHNKKIIPKERDLFKEGW